MRNENSKRSMQKNFVTFGVAVLASLLIAGLVGILALLTDTDSADNTFTIAENTIEVVEEFDPPEQIEAGQTITKDVKVANVDTAQCYVRVFCDFSDSRAAGFASLDYNTEDWTEPDADGWRYYKNILYNGDKTSSLITQIQIAEGVAAEDLIDFDVLVVAESVQAKGSDGQMMDMKIAWSNFGITAVE